MDAQKSQSALSLPWDVRGGSQTQYADELRKLLRSRLLLLGCLFTCIPVLLVLDLLDPDRPLDVRKRGYLPYLIVTSAYIFPLLALWRLPGLSLLRLRLFEVFYFGSGALILGWAQCRWYIENGIATAVGLDIAALWFSILGDSFSLPWFLMIVFYGTCIPTTAPRCAAVVGALSAAAVSVAIGLAWYDTDRGRFLYVVTIPHELALLAMAAAIAIFGSHKLSVLHREAFRSRKLGHYVLKEMLGQGGMGEVYRAEHQLLRRPCAVKLIRPEKAGDPATLRRFQREVQATSALTHPNVVEIYDYGHTTDGTFYYVMEYLEGKDLEAIVKETGPLPPERVVHVLRQVSGVLREAHTAGLIHRDVKPNNILLCERGGVPDVVKLLDFGLVLEQTLNEESEKLTQAGTVLGSPLFMSPEQISGSEKMDGRSDLYSLGLVAYYLLTGKNPFRRPNLRAVFTAHLTEPAPPLFHVCPGVDLDLSAAIMRCLEKDPEARFPDAGSLEQALARCTCAGRWTTERAEAWWRDQQAADADTQDAEPATTG